MTRPFKWVCPRCGGDNCGYDAYSVWDTLRQEEALGGSYDNGWCNDCGEVEPDQVPLTKLELAIRTADLQALPVNRLRRQLEETSTMLSMVIERLELNDCEGEEKPFIREVRAQRRAVRATLRDIKAVR